MLFSCKDFPQLKQILEEELLQLGFQQRFNFFNIASLICMYIDAGLERAETEAVGVKCEFTLVPTTIVDR